MNVLHEHRRQQIAECHKQQTIVAFLTWLINERNRSTDDPHTHVTEGAD